MFTVDAKDVPEQSVLGRRRVVAIPELLDYIYTSRDQLRAEADRAALRVTGPGLTLYYSRVDDETDGEVQQSGPGEMDTNHGGRGGYFNKPAGHHRELCHHALRLTLVRGPPLSADGCRGR